MRNEISKPLTFTVITPSYNQGQFLAETIESVIGQEGDFCLDYIVIDGGSSDDSVAIIRHYQRIFEESSRSFKGRKVRYRWLSEPDHGQTDALIKGFRIAEGDIFAWLNSDDTYLPGTLQSVADSFHENPKVSILYGDAHYCDKEGKVLGRYPSGEFDYARFAYFNFICQPSTFFRREAFEAVGGLDKTLRYAMDYDLFVRISKQFTCRYLPRFLSRYRLHDTSKTIRDDELFENHEEALRLAVNHFGWAPLNRVYGSCNYYCLSRLPRFLVMLRFPVFGSSVLYTLARSLWLNRGLRRADLQVLSLGNLRKIFKGRLEILKG
jgi:glycosyltransferase involved in cell wall biosynthesis